MYSIGQAGNFQEPKIPHIPSTSSTSISSSCASSSSYSMIPTFNLLTPPSNNLISGYKRNAAIAGQSYSNCHGTTLYESKKQAVYFNTPNTTPNIYVPSMPFYLHNNNEMVL